MPSDPIRFSNMRLLAAYDDAIQKLAALPEAERAQRLSDIAVHLTELDKQTDLSADEVGRQARSLVQAAVARRPGLELPTAPGATASDRPQGIEVAPGIRLDPTTALPLKDGKVPADWPQAASALYDLAQAIDADGGNLLNRLGIPQRQALLGKLDALFAGKAFVGSPAEILGDKPATQLRSSAATLLQELVGSLVNDDRPEAKRLLKSALELGVRAARAETHVGLRDSMVFGLYRYQTDLPQELREVTRSLMREVAPLTPNYEAWLKDGKISCDFVVDGDWINVDGLASYLRGQGFERVRDSDPPLMRQTFNPKGPNKAVVEIRLRTNSTNMFDSVGKKDVDIVYFMGHSNYGRALPSSLPGAPKVTGKDQLLMFGTCFGKDNLEQVRQQFPQAELMATFNSAYQGECTHMLRSLWDGIAGRKSWAAISNDIGGPEGGNWVTPAEVMMRRRIMDRDGDGRADILDKLYDVDLQNVPQSLAEGFKPKDPGAPPHRLQTLIGVVAGNWVNRGVSGYNEAIKSVNPRSGVTCAGFFDGKDGEPPVRFAKTTLPDGAEGWTMQVNQRFAHMPEEALRAVAAFEFNRFLAKNEVTFDYKDDAPRALLNGLMAVGFTLSHDLFYNDTEVFAALKKAYGLPEALELDEVERFATMNSADDRDVAAGCRGNIDLYMAELKEKKPELWAALTRAGAGEWQAAK